MTDQVNKMTHEEILKRSEIQFQLINLNVVTAGALAALAYSSNQARIEALLVIPFISFALCAHWIHLGITIRLGDWNAPSQPNKWQSFSRATHVISVLSAFVGIPIVALLVYHPTNPYSLYEIFGFILCGLSLILYVIWYALQYRVKTDPTQIQDKNLKPKTD
jgi:hypothetical protein